jgi:glyoxylase-like metal-dependent hydrolase (beta-lactamase superfamily II)
VTSLAPLTRTGIHRVAVPLSDSPLGSVNVYLIEGDNGPILIDTAWQTADALAAIEGVLGDIGARVEDLSLIVLTHGHPDHTGLAATLRGRSGAPIALHPADWPFVDPVRRQDADYYSKSAGWMRLNGMPDQEQGMARGSRRAMYNRNPPFRPDRQLTDGESLALGPFTFRVIWCPGHAPGQVCLYDPEAQLLIAADHVLPSISPNVGIYSAEDGDPLGQYLASLARVRDLPVDVVFPGHGDPFTGLAARVDTLAAHHEERLAEIVAVLASQGATAFEISEGLTWSGGRRTFADLHPFQQSMALAETIAHLELLRRRGVASREERDGRLWWRRAA